MEFGDYKLMDNTNRLLELISMVNDKLQGWDGKEDILPMFECHKAVDKMYEHLDKAVEQLEQVQEFILKEARKQLKLKY